MCFLLAKPLRIGIMAVCFLMVFSLFTQARNSLYNPKTLHQDSGAIGITQAFSNHKLFIMIDQEKLLKNSHKLQKSGILDPNLTKTEINIFQPVLAASISISYVANIVKTSYMTDAKVDKIHVDAYLFSPDLYGHHEKKFCYSFDFNRTLYQKINWEKFQGDNLKQIAPDFKTSQVCHDLKIISPTMI